MDKNTENEVMELEFKLNRRQYKNMKSALESLSLFWKGNIEGLVKMFENSFNVDGVEVKTSEKEQLLLKSVLSDTADFGEAIDEILKKIPASSSGSFTTELTDVEVNTICVNLDLFNRIVLGQWGNIAWQLIGRKGEHFSNAYMEMVRDTIVPFLATHNYGICHPDLSQKVFDVYNIYKEIMYKKGAGGVYGYTPMILAGDEKNIPEVTFPITYEYTFPDNYEFGRLPEFEEWCKEAFPKPEYPFYESYEEPYIFDEDDNFYWVRYADSHLTKATGGLRVVKRHHKIPEVYRDGEKVVVRKGKK